MADNVPKIRFPGFTEPWEQRKFKDLVFKSGKKNKKNLPYESFSITNESGFVSQNEQFENGGTMKDADKSMYIIVSPNSFAYNPARINVGSIGYQALGKNVIVSSLYEVFKTSHEVDDHFLWYWFKSDHFKRLVESLQEGGVRLYFYFDKLQKGELWLPPIEEQRKIGGYFKSVDNLITLHQRKLDDLKKLKSGLLQKMFPKAGETVPEVRFPEFTGDWEQRKLGEIGNTFSGLSGKTKEDFGHGQASFVTYLNVFNNSIGQPNMIEKVEIDPKQFQVKQGDILFTTSSETPDEVGMACVWPVNLPNLYLNSFCFGFRPKKEIDINFYAHMLRSPQVRNQITLLAQGISRYNISKTKMMDIRIWLPSESEQRRIGRFLGNIDNLITLHQRKLDDLKKLKQGLLQQMLV